MYIPAWEVLKWLILRRDKVWLLFVSVVLIEAPSIFSRKPVEEFEPNQKISMKFSNPGTILLIIHSRWTGSPDLVIGSSGNAIERTEWGSRKLKKNLG